MMKSEYFVSKYLDSIMVYFNTTGFRMTKVNNMYSDPNMLSDTMMKSGYLVSKNLDTIMVYSNAFGIRVIIVDHMYLCPCDAELSLS